MNLKDKKTQDELKKKNSKLYQVACEGGTEPPFTGKYVHEKASGMYRCAVCGANLFSSDTKFDSGTGWPSFYDPVAQDSLKYEEDKSGGLVRTEVKCAKCSAHLGHVFPDGPEPTGERYCINSVSLDLKIK